MSCITIPGSVKAKYTPGMRMGARCKAWMDGWNAMYGDMCWVQAMYVTLTDCFSRVQRVLTDWLRYWQCTKTARAYPGITPYVYFLFYLILCSILRGSRLMYCTGTSNGWWERFWSALDLCTVQETSVANGSASEALQAYEQYMEMYTLSMYSTGDIHFTVYRT